MFQATRKKSISKLKHFSEKVIKKSNIRRLFQSFNNEIRIETKYHQD